MAFFKDLINNLSYLSKRIIPGAPISSDELSLTQLNYSGIQDPADREAIYPQWFFSSRLGQPRQVDTQKIRNLAQSSWVQMVLNTFKRQIYTTEWDIVPEDPDDKIDHKADIKEIKDFLRHINDNHQTIDDVNSELITDIGEIDAGIINLVYTSDSYVIGEVPTYDAWGRVIGNEPGLVLKPLKQRQLLKAKAVDGSTMLKQVDIHKNLLNYWQYSFKHPRQNPTRFEKEEIVYLLMNMKSYSVYGFSAVQAIQQVLELLIQGTRYNKDLYVNNAIPDWLISLPKLNKDKLRKLKRTWNNKYKGRPHQIGFINWAVDKFLKLAESNRDLEWLDGQKWYFKIVFGVFGVSATEAGFFENANKSNDEGQARVTVRNAIKPYLTILENAITTRLIPEILQNEDSGLKFVYQPKDHALEQIEFEQDMKEIELGVMTINEYRLKVGREVKEWGDEPLRRPFNPMDSFSNFGGMPPQNPNPKDKDKDKKFRKNFEKFIKI